MVNLTRARGDDGEGHAHAAMADGADEQRAAAAPAISRRGRGGPARGKMPPRAQSSAIFRVHGEWCSLREPPYERSTPRLPWGVKGGARAVGGHTLTNRHSFIAGVKRSRGPRLAICTPEHRLAGVVPFQ